MRFTQFGHHVPRRNSRINLPSESSPSRVNVPSRLAACSAKYGASEPISRVSVRSFMLRLTVSEVEIRNNNGWGTGDILPDDLLVRSHRPTGSAPSDIISFRPLRRGRLCLRSINRFYINPTNKGRTDVYHQHCRYSRTPGS